MPQSGDSLLSLAARIVIAQVEHNDTPCRALPGLIRDVYQALASTGPSTGPPPVQANSRPVTARKAAGSQSVLEDHLNCMECGLQMKMLKRHLQAVHNTTPAQYREKWRLPVDYPMVARQYAALRSSLAKESGLGKRPVTRQSKLE